MYLLAAYGGPLPDVRAQLEAPPLALHRYDRCRRDITPYYYVPDLIHDTQHATVTLTSVNDATYTLC